MQETLRVLPHHFEPIYSDGLWIIADPQEDIKITLQEKYRGTDGFKHLGKFQGHDVLISGAHDLELGTIDNPIPSKSPNSKATYLLWREKDIAGEKVLVAVHALPEFTMSSHHKHNNSSEKFQKLDGKSYNYHNENTVRVDHQLKTLPGDSHLSFTTDQAALTLLVQRGTDIVHAHLPQPSYQLLKEEADLLDKRLPY